MASMKMMTRKVGKYEVGRTIGEGTFAKVKFAQNMETGESVAVKVMVKSSILKHKMVDQIKREISIMKIVRHPNIVRLHESWSYPLIMIDGLFGSKAFLSLDRLVCIGQSIDRLVCPGRSTPGNHFFSLLLVSLLWFSGSLVQCESLVQCDPWVSGASVYIAGLWFSGSLSLSVSLVHKGRLSENESRCYFQQLIDAVAHCHSKGVYHRDLKPENLLLDSHGNLKVSDFGLSALPQQGVELLHTTCGTPNYVAPEVLCHRGYDGAAADVWSCGVILYVLMAGYLPFDDIDLPTLYQKINVAEFSCPIWFSPGAKSLIHKILDPNPEIRIKIEGIKNDPWFRQNYVAVKQGENEDVNLDDVRAVFDDIELHPNAYLIAVGSSPGLVDTFSGHLIVSLSVLAPSTALLPSVDSGYGYDLISSSDQYVIEQSTTSERGPLIMNAFEMITLSQGLNLSALFDRRQDYVKRQTRFVSRQPAKLIISTIEAVAESMGLKVHTRYYKTRLEGVSANKKGPIAVVLEVYEVAPSLFMVDVRKAAGDTLEYHKAVTFFFTKLQPLPRFLISQPKT
ncbi:hypothetical protein TEA_003925 [Camellia sinensis var. sinensis]|uniref:non-specific serine/threonine protein kinase n=1 Tax=Camellia sinensis var. sinensis TaxID=542762 RepID=A0A4S4F3X0_CAMSN|nr:hypothetical protein TEA_003925 [Camellia sinensis var. sinensis]